MFIFTLDPLPMILSTFPTTLTIKWLPNDFHQITVPAFSSTPTLPHFNPCLYLYFREEWIIRMLRWQVCFISLVYPVTQCTHGTDARFSGQRWFECCFGFSLYMQYGELFFYGFKESILILNNQVCRKCHTKPRRNDTLLLKTEEQISPKIFIHSYRLKNNCSWWSKTRIFLFVQFNKCSPWDTGNKDRNSL